MKTRAGFVVVGLLVAGGFLYASPPGFHSADYNPPDWRISLSELLRVVQFYNSGQYHAQVGTDDGYGPGPGPSDGFPHDSDFKPQDWKIGLPELLRLVQFYNSTGYHVEAGTDDGYAPGFISDPNFFTPAMISVAAGTFDMGRTSAGDDAKYGRAMEVPVHTVTLGAYQIGKYEVMNREYCSVLNWALAHGCLKTSTGAAWSGTGDIYAGGNLQVIVQIILNDCHIQYSGGVFSSKTRTGLPGTTNYSMDTHPMIRVTWYGAAAFCNWLSQMHGLTPCYDMSTADWPLTTPPPMAGGYRLPTEAEWERAAAWDGSRHWIYGYTADTLTGNALCNYYGPVNPLGLDLRWCTSPAGWFDGVHVSPNGDVATENGASPVGAYDMSGNAFEWCQDWYLNTYYTTGGPPWVNPTGPATGSVRSYRGGCYGDAGAYSRTAVRINAYPSYASNSVGFRVAKS